MTSIYGVNKRKEAAIRLNVARKYPTACESLLPSSSPDHKTVVIPNVSEESSEAAASFLLLFNANSQLNI
jgi:hypothetical protein